MFAFLSSTGKSVGGKTRRVETTRAYRLPTRHVASYLRNRDACSYGTVHEHELTRLNTSAKLTGTLTLHDDYD